MSLTLTRSEALEPEPREGLGLDLLLIADDVVDLVHGGEAGGIDLRGAAGDDDLGVGPRAADLADRLARLAHGLTRHGASVDDHGVAEPRRVRMLAHDLGFIGVEPAAEGDDLDIRHGRLLTRNLERRQGALIIERVRAGHEDMAVRLPPLDREDRRPAS